VTDRQKHTTQHKRDRMTHKTEVTEFTGKSCEDTDTQSPTVLHLYQTKTAENLLYY